MSFKSVAASTFFWVALAAPALAQAPFILSVTGGNSNVGLQNGGSLTFSSTIGQAQTDQITATYTGTNQAVISAPPVVSGSTSFSAVSSSAIPTTLSPGQRFVFSVQFLPASATAATAQVSLSYVEKILVTTTAPCVGTPGTCTTTTTTNTNGSLSFAVQGTAPSFVLSYVLQSTQNAVTLSPGGTVVFPPTQVNTTAQAALNISNTGSAAGSVTGLSITGSAFKFSGQPILPDSVGAGQNLQVQILYQPTTTNPDSGQIQVTLSGGSPITISLQGSGSSASLVYQVLQPLTTVSPGGTLALPSTNVGQSSSVTVRVSNSGNASGAVTTLGVSGQGFQLSSPPPLPQTLAPNASLTFTINFTPTQPGTLTGTLTINLDTVNLSGVGLGSQLTYSYQALGSTITIGTANPSMVFSPVQITQSAQLVLDVKNTGTLQVAISNIGISQTNSPFTVSGTPALPVVLAPNSDFQITITFAPVSLGFSNGTVQFDSATVPLVGSGTQPPPLPPYTITGPNGNATPMSQPMFGLSLANPYPVAVSGTLTLAVAGNPVVDPAVQFSSGGLTAPFVIPANSSSAVFTNQGNQIGLQTGTVASTITLTPSFATQTGGVILTPATPNTLQFAITPAPPALIAAQIGSVTTTAPLAGSSVITSSFVLTVTGFSVPRSLSAFNVQFTAATGFSIPITQFKVDLTQLSTLWFQSTASVAFGGQFALAVPFTFQGTPPSGQTLLNSIGAVSVSMTNNVGTSNTLQVNVQ